jgi:hypothetical protein
MIGRAGWMLLLALALAARGAGAGTVDDFRSVAAWSARPADGVELAVAADTGARGGAMRLDFRFVKGGGYAIAHRDLSLDLPSNYVFSFHVRGNCRPQTLEFKLIDSTGANVWWCNRRDFRFTPEGVDVRLRKRHIQFAWGPAGGGDLRRVAAIELAITAGSGGAGSAWIEDFRLEPLPPSPPPGTRPPTPVPFASTSGVDCPPERAVDGNPATFWVPAKDDPAPWLALDLGDSREFGGLTVDWYPGMHPAEYAVEASGDRQAWRELQTVRGSSRDRDYIHAPESEARYLRVRPFGIGLQKRAAIRELAVQPLEWSASREAFFRSIAWDSRRGTYPRGMSGDQVYWTVVGADGGPLSCLLSEDGALETARASCSIEPFLLAGGGLVTWADVRSTQSLEDGSLPIPSVRWTSGGLELAVTAFAAEPGSSISGLRSLGDLAGSVFARYRVRNLGAATARVRLVLALRPFQVNPPTQFLNTPGGTARVESLQVSGCAMRSGGREVFRSLTRPTESGAATFAAGDVTDFLRQGRVPPLPSVADAFGAASGAFAYDLEIPPGAEREVDGLVPARALIAARCLPDSFPGPGEVVLELEAARRAWRARTGRVEFSVPDSAADVIRTLKAQLGYILVNREGPSIRPGTRSYARSWIRDGALTGSALLRLGETQAVKEFVEWFAGYQYDNGKVPCCVDARGSDPVPENDSGGEFVFLVAEYFRYTGDRATVERLWPSVSRAVGYLDSLRRLRRTAAFQAPDRREYFGLLPESISHEGYSAKPMHSYWDDLFALRGFKDAAYLAGVTGRREEQVRLERIRDEFQADLLASLRAAMAAHHIDYLPGCAELGDFDATSTTIALDPVQADGVLPRAALEATFEKYWQFFRSRADGTRPWKDFTPYEVRTIGAMVRLGWRDRANQAVEFFLGYRRPAGWAQWPEVVWPSLREPRFLGDLPHTWVGSDFVRSVLDMFVYLRESDSSVVVGAGVPWSWVARGTGLAVKGLRTPAGRLDLAMRAYGDTLRAELSGGLRVPPGGVVVRAPVPGGAKHATVNGRAVPVNAAGEVVVRRLPARVEVRP